MRLSYVLDPRSRRACHHFERVQRYERHHGMAPCDHLVSVAPRSRLSQFKVSATALSLTWRKQPWASQLRSGRRRVVDRRMPRDRELLVGHRLAETPRSARQCCPVTGAC